jgi:hypothetical protein
MIQFKARSTAFRVPTLRKSTDLQWGQFADNILCFGSSPPAEGIAVRLPGGLNLLRCSQIGL